MSWLLFRVSYSKFVQQYAGGSYNGRPESADLFWKMELETDGNVTISRPLKGKL